MNQKDRQKPGAAQSAGWLDTNTLPAAKTAYRKVIIGEAAPSLPLPDASCVQEGAP